MSGSPLGQYCADIAAAMTREFGGTVTIHRRASTAGGAATTSTAVAQVQPLGMQAYSALRLEGIVNANEPLAKLFIFEQDADVSEGIDSIVWAGWRYRVLHQDVIPLGDTDVCPFAVAVREVRSA